MKNSITYADAGVDVNKADALVEAIKTIARKTHRRGVMGEIGGFGGLFSLATFNFENPVLVSSTDGVGTKLKIAFMTRKHDTIGIDLVAMCVNDILVQGAKPLFFLDYFSTGRLDTEIAKAVIEGIAEGCRQAKCALIGGETAEMPEFYQPGEYDLAGFAVGVVDNKKIIDGSEIRVGHQLVGIASSGLHSNGYSLVRKICFDLMQLTPDSYIESLGCTIGEELLRPTRIYAETVRHILRDMPIHGLAHITGGGLASNLLRIIPRACQVSLKKGSWEIPPIFPFLQEAGNISESEMQRTFNNGIGMVAVTPAYAAQDLVGRLRALNEKAFVIGEVTDCKGGADQQRCEWI